MFARGSNFLFLVRMASHSGRRKHSEWNHSESGFWPNWNLSEWKDLEWKDSETLLASTGITQNGKTQKHFKPQLESLGMERLLRMKRLRITFNPTGKTQNGKTVVKL
jgi:hypothetical protein